ncbi:MAG: hypothetical protein HKN56_10965 [Gammaproteobacteria bacterium]|nr:hypothetical protein [Gammaproteobacteria bacterium]
MTADRPIYALNYTYATDSLIDAPDSIEALARHYIRQMLQVQPTGPYFFFGFSSGATIAYEMILQLLAGGQRVAHAVFIEPTLNPKGTLDNFSRIAADVGSTGLSINSLANFSRVFMVMAKRRPRVIRDAIRTRWHRALGTPMPPRLRWLNYLAHIRPAVSSYVYKPLSVPVDFFYRGYEGDSIDYYRRFWSATTGAHVELHTVSGTDQHLDLMSERALQQIAAVLDQRVLQFSR